LTCGFYFFVLLSLLSDEERNMKRFKCLLALFLGLLALSLPVGATPAEEEALRQYAKKSFASNAGNARRWADKIVVRQLGSTTQEKTAVALLQAAIKEERNLADDTWKGGAMIPSYNEIDRRFGKDKNPVIRAVVVEGLARKGVSLRWCGAFGMRDGSLNGYCLSFPEAAMGVFEDIERRFGQDDDPNVRAQFVRSLVEKGAVWWKENNLAAAISDYDKIISRFENETSPVVRAQLIYALQHKAKAMERAGAGRREVLAVYDEIDRRFGKDDAPEVQKMLIESLLSQAWIVHQEQPNMQAILTFCDHLNQRFEKNGDVRYGISLILNILSSNANFYDQIEQRFGLNVKILDRNGHLLQQQGKFDAAMAIYDGIEQHFGVFGNHFVAMSLLRKGEILEQQGKIKEAIDTYSEVERRFGSDHGYVQWRFGKKFAQQTQDYVARAAKAHAAVKLRLLSVQ
jgi:tetratricopeptide (TPR) repeat protein